MRTERNSFYSREGQPLTQAEWEQVPKGARATIARDVIGDITVSTVYLGLDHGWGDGPPLIFESMVFGGKHNEDQERYTTEQEAKEGHQRLVEMVHAEGLTPSSPAT